MFSRSQESQSSQESEKNRNQNPQHGTPRKQDVDKEIHALKEYLNQSPSEPKMSDGEGSSISAEEGWRDVKRKKKNSSPNYIISNPSAAHYKRGTNRQNHVQTADFKEFFDSIKSLELNEQFNKLQYALIIISKELNSDSKLEKQKLACFVVAVVNTFTNLLEAGVKPEARYIAVLLHRAGVILNQSKSTLQNKSLRITNQTINTLLDQLCKNPDTIPQEIANAVYGLGQLAQAGCLAGQIPAETLGLLMSQLSQKENCKAQAIGSGMFGLGRLAEAEGLAGQIPAEILGLLMCQLSTQEDCDAPGISNSLYGLGLLAESGCLDGQMPMIKLKPLIEKKLNKSSQQIGNTVQGLGRMAKAGSLEGQISAETLGLLMRELSEAKDCDDQAIAHTVYGLGRMAEAGCLMGQIPAEMLERLTHELNEKLDSSLLHIANALYGLMLCSLRPNLAVLKALSVQVNQLTTYSATEMSQIAQAWLILGVSNSLPDSMIQALKKDQPKPQIKQLSILKKLGQNKFIRSVKAEVLIGAWFVDILIELEDGRKIIVELDGKHHCRNGVLRLEDQRRDAWLVKEGFPVLRFKNDVAIDEIIKEVERRFCSRPLSNVELFVEGQLSGKTKAQDNSEMAWLEPSPLQNNFWENYAQEIDFNGLFASIKYLGLDEQCDQLHDILITTSKELNSDSRTEKPNLPRFVVEILNKFTGLLACGADPKAKVISSLLKKAQIILSHFKFIVPDETLGITTQTIHALLNHLCKKSDCNGVDIVDSMYALGKLVEAGFLIGQIPAEIFELFMYQLNNNIYCTPKGITNLVFSLYRLAKTRSLMGSISLRNLGLLVCQLSEKNLDSKPQDIANTVFALGQLAEMNLLKGQIPAKIFEQLIDKLSKSVNGSPKQIMMMVYGLGQLAKAKNLDGQILAGKVEQLINLLSQKVDNNTFQDIANMVYGLGWLIEARVLLGQISIGQLELLNSRLGEKLDTSSQGIVNAVYGLMLCSLRPNLAVLKALSIQVNQLTTYSATENSQIAQVWLILDVSNSLPDSMIQVLKQDQPSLSIKQQVILKVLKQNKLVRTIKAQELIGAWFVDLSLELENGAKVIIHLDEVLNGDILRSEDQRRDVWLEKQGFHVLRFKNNIAADKIFKEIEQRFCSQVSSKVSFFVNEESSEKTPADTPTNLKIPNR